jgi:hypothetical protein
VSFLDGDSITLDAGEVRREVAVRVRPGRDHQVRFAILPDSDAPNDASLSDTIRTTDDDGEAHVFLNAPSAPTTFSLRASVGDSTATLSVSVSAEGYARVQATPEYTGLRAVDEWTGG